MEEQQGHQHQQVHHSEHHQQPSQPVHHASHPTSHIPQPTTHHSQPSAPSLFQQLKQQLYSFWLECVRVFRVTKKPDKTEYFTTLKISGLGILLIGAIGFIIFVAKEIIMKFV